MPLLRPEVIEAEHLPEPYRRMAKVIGVEPTLKVAQEFAGRTLYFPKIADQDFRNREIRRRFNGYNAKELAREFGLTERRVRGIARRQ